VALLGDGGLLDLPGGVEQYLELRRQALQTAGPPLPAPTGDGDAHDQGRAGPTAAEAREARKELARVERQLSRLAEREERVHAAMVEAATDHERVLALNAQLRELVEERETLELAWLEAAEILG
jgi:hypothetical protein